MMLASFETGNLGLLWVLIEASTLASCVLVGLEGKSVSLEAAWKYIIISSFGVTIALVGTLFLYFAASNLPGSPTEHLTWSYLFAHAGASGSRACGWRSYSRSSATAPRSGWRRCTPGSLTHTPRRPARPAQCCRPRC